MSISAAKLEAGANVKVKPTAHIDGKIPEHLYVRGWWDDLRLEDDTLSFHQESAWEPLYEAWDFIATKFPSIAVYFNNRYTIRAGQV